MISPLAVVVRPLQAKNLAVSYLSVVALQIQNWRADTRSDFRSGAGYPDSIEDDVVAPESIESAIARSLIVNHRATAALNRNAARSKRVSGPAVAVLIRPGLNYERVPGAELCNGLARRLPWAS